MLSVLMSMPLLAFGATGQPTAVGLSDDEVIQMFTAGNNGHLIRVICNPWCEQGTQDLGLPIGVTSVQNPSATGDFDNDHINVFAIANTTHLVKYNPQQGWRDFGRLPMFMQPIKNISAMTYYDEKAIEDEFLVFGDTSFLDQPRVIQEMQVIHPDSSLPIILPSGDTFWHTLGDPPASATPATSAVTNPISVSFSDSNDVQHIFVFTVGDNGLIYEDYSVDNGSTWTWQRVHGVPPSITGFLSHIAVAVSPQQNSQGLHDVNIFVTDDNVNDNGHLYEIQTHDGIHPLRQWTDLGAAPFGYNGPQLPPTASMEPKNPVAVDYVDPDGSENVYVFANADVGFGSVSVVMRHWNSSGWSPWINLGGAGTSSGGPANLAVATYWSDYYNLQFVDAFSTGQFGEVYVDVIDENGLLGQEYLGNL